MRTTLTQTSPRFLPFVDSPHPLEIPSLSPPLPYPGGTNVLQRYPEQLAHMPLFRNLFSYPVADLGQNKSNVELWQISDRGPQQLEKVCTPPLYRDPC